MTKGKDFLKKRISKFSKSIDLFINRKILPNFRTDLSKTGGTNMDMDIMVIKGRDRLKSLLEGKELYKRSIDFDDNSLNPGNHQDYNGERVQVVIFLEGPIFGEKQPEIKILPILKEKDLLEAKRWENDNNNIFLYHCWLPREEVLSAI